jgi:Protein of unknown function/AsmA-like C-terminal region
LIRRTATLALEVVAVLTAGFAAAVGFAAWRLSSGPVAIEFLSPYLERALSPQDKGFDVKIDNTILTWGGWNRPIEIRAIALKALTPENKVIAEIPEMTVNLSARALMVGQIAPTALTVLRPHLTVQRAADGRFSMGLNPADQPSGPFVSNLVSGLLTEPGGGSLSYLTHINIVGGSLTVRDRHLGFAWHAPETNLSLRRDATGVRGEVSAHVTIDGRKISLDGLGIYSRGAKTIEVGLNFAGLEPALFARGGENAGALEALRVVQLPLNGVVNATIAEDGHVQKVGFELKGESGSINLPEPFHQTYRIASFYLHGEGNEDLDHLTIDSFDVRTDGPRLAGSIELTDVRVKPKARVGISISDMPMDTLRNYWPGGAGSNARRWVLANMKDGFVKEMQATLEASAQDSRGLGSDFEVDAISGAMIYEGLTINYMSPLPPARKVRGSATFNQDRFDFTATEGDFAGLAVERASIAITDMMANEQRAKISGTLRGPLRDALALIDSEPFRYAQKIGVTPAQVSGSASIDLSFDFPLNDNLTFEQVQLKGTAKLHDVIWNKALYGLDLSKGDLGLVIDKTQMKVSGKADIGGTPADLVWSEMFADKPKFRRQLQLKGTLEDAMRQAVGLEFGGFLTGPIGASVQLTDYGNDRTTIDSTLDLTPTDFDLSFLGARKRAGVKGTADLTVDLVKGRPTELRKFAVNADGFIVAGSAKFKAKGGGLEQVQIDRLKNGLTDISIAARSRDDGAYVIEVRGARLDAGQLLNRRRRAAANGSAPPQDLGPLPPIVMRADVDRLYFAADRYISRTTAEAEYRDDQWRRFVLNGMVAEGKAAAVRLVPNGTGQALSVTSADAGATLRALNLFDTVVGGTLDIQGAIADDKPETPLPGVATMTNFRVNKAPVMARVMSLASFTGISDVLSGETGMAFDKASMPFTYFNNVIDVREGQAYGSEVGITVSGRFDVKNDRTDLRGTVVPAYTLNSLIGKIPLIGPLLVGEKGSGIFAATYSVRGPSNNPDVSVNPLAALTPGFLRGLFSIFDSDGDTGGMNGPAPDNAEVTNDSY